MAAAVWESTGSAGVHGRLHRKATTDANVDIRAAQPSAYTARLCQRKPRDEHGSFPAGLSPAEAERAGTAARRAGEAQQSISKILRHGYEARTHHQMSGPTNREALEKEVADVYVAARMMFEAGDMRRIACAGHEERKTESVQRFLHHQGNNA